MEGSFTAPPTTAEVIEFTVTYNTGARHTQWFYADDFVPTAEFSRALFVPVTVCRILDADGSS